MYLPAAAVSLQPVCLPRFRRLGPAAAISDHWLPSCLPLHMHTRQLPQKLHGAKFCVFPRSSLARLRKATAVAVFR